MILVTGGAGFIGSNFILHWVKKNLGGVLNLDKLTYAGNLSNLSSIAEEKDYVFVQGDIADRQLVRALLQKHAPSAIVHFAAETHVDRSISGPENFVHTNVLGSFQLLDEAFNYWKELPGGSKESFRFLNVSTDEVYGSLELDAPPASESNSYFPNSPYAASKASFDHFVRAYHETFGFPTLITHASNNFGPFQFPEKLIPLIIINAIQGKSLPVYGDGLQIRNWIYVEDHCQALIHVLAKGKPGEHYNIGNHDNTTNIELVNRVCYILDQLLPDSPFKPHASLIRHVRDRPGHDRRYALNSSKLSTQLGWSPPKDFEEKLETTIKWYLDNQQWVSEVTSGEYRNWIAKHYG